MATLYTLFFSVYENIPAPAGVALDAAPITRESEKHRFLVDEFFSYDVRGLSDMTPNDLPPQQRLSSKEQNSNACIDLALRRWLAVQQNLTASGVSQREAAGAILQRVKVAGVGRPEILDLAELCQPLWVHPWLGNMENAKAFFRNNNSSKWDDEQWTVCKSLY